MASVAAGKRDWQSAYGKLTGMAPDASLWAVSVMSKMTYPVQKLWGYRADILAAMQKIGFYSQAGNGNNMTLSMSIGEKNGESDPKKLPMNTPCPSESTVFNSIVASLVSNNVPVIASTGNNKARGQVWWPACAPKVIKAAGFEIIDPVKKLASLWESSNVVNPTVLSGDSPLFLAPCCAVVATHAPLLSSSGPAAGTSVSAPFIAGLYAAIKAANPGITVAVATEWIKANAKNDITIVTGSQAYPIPRIHVPNL